MPREIIKTDRAPQAIGPYSQAIRIDHTVYISGQIPLLPATMEMIAGDMRAQVARVFENIAGIAGAAGGTLADIAKLTIYLVDLQDFPLVNEVMAEYFQPPYPARAAVGVAGLPKNSRVEMDAVLVLPE